MEPPPGLALPGVCTSSPMPPSLGCNESIPQATNLTNVIQCLEFLEAAVQQEAAEPEKVEHALQAETVCPTAGEDTVVEQTAVEEDDLVLEPEAVEEESAEEEAVVLKAPVAAPTPQELKAAALILAKSCRKGNKSQGKGRAEPKQQGRAEPKQQRSKLVVPVPHKVVGDIDADSIEDKVVWWQVLLTLGLVTFLLVAFVAIRPARLMSSGAHATSLSVAPGISNALTTVVPAGACVHMRNQLVSSLAKTMDVEFARADAVASFMKSKISDVRRARKIRREQKNEKAAAEEQAKATGHFQTWRITENGAWAPINTVV